MQITIKLLHAIIKIPKIKSINAYLIKFSDDKKENMNILKKKIKSNNIILKKNGGVIEMISNDTSISDSSVTEYLINNPLQWSIIYLFEKYNRFS